MIFDLVNNEPIITIEGLHIPELNKIWVMDKTKNKLKASGALKYVYHMSYPDSVYSKLSEEERPIIVKEDYIVDNWYPESELKDAIEKVIKLEVTPEMRFLSSCEYALKALEDFNYSIDFKLKDEKGKQIFKITEVIASIEKAGKLFESILSLKNTINKTRTTKTKRKGNVKPSSILHE
jgi:hypothetical protein